MSYISTQATKQIAVLNADSDTLSLLRASLASEWDLVEWTGHPDLDDTTPFIVHVASPSDAEELVELASRHKVIAVGDGDDNTQLAAFDAGADDFIRLTDSPELIRRRVRAILSRGPQPTAANDETDSPVEELMSHLRHELKTPLNAILGFSRVLLQQGNAGELNERQQRYLENVSTGGQNLLNLIETLLDVASSDTEAGFSIAPFSAKERAEGVIELLTGTKYKRKIEIDSEIDGEAILVGDGVAFRRHLFRILFGLANTSLEGSRIQVRLKAVNEFVILSVERLLLAPSADGNESDGIPDAVIASATTLANRFKGTSNISVEDNSVEITFPSAIGGKAPILSSAS